MDFTEFTDTQLWAMLEGVDSLNEEVRLPSKRNKEEVDSLVDEVIKELARRTNRVAGELKGLTYSAWIEEHSPFSGSNGAEYG